MKKSVFICFLFLVANPSAVLRAQNTTKEAEAIRAWELYNDGRYKEARDIVDRNDPQVDGNFALLSGLLYVQENRCKDAIAAISKIEKYYDSRQEELEKDSDIKQNYFALKKISIYCNKELGDWVELVRDLRVYLNLVQNEEKLKALVLLADSYSNLAQSSINGAIDRYEQVLAIEPASADQNVIRENVLFHVSGLYVLVGEKEKAIARAVELLRGSPNAPMWIEQMQNSKKHSWILRQAEVKDIVISIQRP